MNANIIKTLQILEYPVSGRRLGRHVSHDPRSWNHPAPMAAQIQSVRHEQLVPIFTRLSHGPSGWFDCEPHWGLTESLNH